MTAGELALDRPRTNVLSRPEWRVGIAQLAVLGVLAPVAYMAAFGIFQTYDDEGYFLITLKDFMSGHPLFTQALPIYGPFYYEAVGGAMRTLGIQPSLDAARLITVGVWLATTLLAGVVVYRLTGNGWLAIAGELVTFRVLVALVNEPIQPAGLIALLTLTLMLIVTFNSRAPRVAAAATGAIIAALLLIKVNIGIFTGAAVMFAWVATLAPAKRRLALPAVGVAVAILPVVLMSSLLGIDWVAEFAVLATLSLVAFGVVTIRSRAASGGGPGAFWVIAGALGVVAVCLAVMAAGGTPLADWWNRSIVLASKFPRVFVWPVAVNALYDLWAIVAMGGAIALSGRYARVAAPPAAGLLRVWVGLLMWISMISLPALLLVLPLAWVAVLAPPGDDPRPIHHQRVFLAALATIGSLQVFPVAGTQLSVAALGLLPLGAIILSDGIRQLKRGGAVSQRAVRIADWVAPSAFGIGVAAVLLLVLVTTANFAASVPLGLNGAEAIRQSADKTAQLRSLVTSIDRNCSSFITYPGMDSFYLWTGQQPPAEVTSEVWWLVLGSEQQQSLVDQLRTKPRMCVVKNQRVIDFWASGRAVPDRPLVRWIDDNFAVSASFGDYELLVRRSS